MMNRIAIIGLGKMGLLHASLLNTMPEVDLVAVCERSRLIRRFSKNLIVGVPVVDSVDSLSGFDLDAVYVTTPPSSHHAILDAVFAKGLCRNAFVEKPLANTIAESRHIESLPGSLGIDSINMVGYNRRFSVTLRKAKQIIEDGTLGEPVSFEAYGFSSDFQAAEGAERRNRGGVVKDLASHAIDLAIWLVGDICVESVVSSQVSNSGVIDAAAVRVTADTGLPGHIRASWSESDYRLPEIGFTMEGSNGLTLAVTEDMLGLHDKHGCVEAWHRHDLDDVTSYLLGGTEYMREDQAFMNAISSGKAIEPNFSTALRVDETIHSIEMQISG